MNDALPEPGPELAAALAVVGEAARLERCRVPGTDLEIAVIDARTIADVQARAEAIMAAPPYWAIAWPAGVALARCLARCGPDLLSRADVLDFGAGSGLVGLAAAQAGASVTCCDTDPAALAAVRVNAAINGVEVATVAEPVAAHWCFAADLLYDAETRSVIESLGSERVVVAESRAPDALPAEFQPIATVNASALPDLDDHRRVTVAGRGLSDGDRATLADALEER